MLQQFEAYGDTVFQYGVDEDELETVKKGNDTRARKDGQNTLKRTIKVTFSNDPNNNLSERKVFKS